MCETIIIKVLFLGTSIGNNSMKKKETIWATYIAFHTSISSVDHSGKVLNTVNKTSASTSTNNETYHIHRTKCSAIIREVIAPSFMKMLIKDIGTSLFSIIVDESTDVSTHKLLCVCIKYYSNTKNDIITQFLAFVNIVSATAEKMYTML